MPPIPTGPAWAVALALVFGGLAVLLKASVPIVQSIRRNGKNGGSVVGRLEAVTEIKEHMDSLAAEARESRDKIMTNIDNTRHAINQPLTTAALNLALILQTLEQIRDRLPTQ